MVVNGNQQVVEDKIFDFQEEPELYKNIAHVENIVFRNCTFCYMTIKDSLISNYSFENCIFFDVLISGCKLNNITFINCCLKNNSEVVGNIFNNFKGRNITNTSNGVYRNYFKNTNFSGCEGIYYNSDSNNLEWYENYFINSTIDIASIERLYNLNPKYLTHIGTYTNVSINQRVQLCQGVFRRITHGMIVVNLQDVVPKVKLNIISNLFTNFSEEELLEIDVFDDHYFPLRENKKYIEEIEIKGSINKQKYYVDKHSQVCLRTIKNPYPLRIVDAYGNKLKDDVIKPIFLRDRYLLSRWCSHIITYLDASVLNKTYNEENDLLNENNYKQTQLVLSRKKKN